MTYEAALAYIASLQGRGWRLGLDRMEAFVDYLGLSDFVAGREGCRFLHIAGTNGKGSVTAFLQSILVEAGHRTGAFFSPYVIDPRERIQIGRDMIEKEELASIVADLAAKADAFGRETDQGGITEFEFKTAVAFEAWRRARCEWVAVEVGLGGRLDATNVIQPAAGIIVSIGLDHVRILGETLGEIAWEKAGILKPGIPCVVGDLAPEAMRAVEAVAARVGAPLHRPDGGLESLRPSLVGKWQRSNAALAATAVRLAGAAGSEAIERGVSLASAPGRFQVERIGGRTVVFDGAHNAAAAAALAETLAIEFPGRPLRLVTNMLEGHDPIAFYKELPRPEMTYVAPIDFFRAVSPGETAERLNAIGWPVRVTESPGVALSRALDEAEADEIVVVTGSNYLVGEAILAM